MILVTGGCFQGKTDYACETFHIAKEEAADGMDCPMEAIYETKLLYHFHEYIKRCMEANQELDLEELERRNPDIVLVSQEVGYGVVPMDAFDRKYREAVGRICTSLAAKSRKVTRVVCGIGTVIKNA